MRRRTAVRTSAAYLLFAFLLGTSQPAAPSSAPVDAKSGDSAIGTDNGSKTVQQGLRVEFSARPSTGPSREILEGETAFVEFRIREDATGKTIPALTPLAWMDIASPRGAGGLTCKEKVKLFLKGTLNIRPTVDMNTYFLITLNKDASLSVIDPLVGISGFTNLYAVVLLSQPGEDWAGSGERNRLYVTMPDANQVAAVDTETFRLLKNIDAGSKPVRILLQPDGKYLWVGNDAGSVEESGVSVLDADGLTVVKKIPTGKGHHELAVSDDSRFAFVSNREDGTVSVIDVRTLEKIKDIRVGSRPAGMAYSRTGKALYVAVEDDGDVVVLDGERHEIAARIPAKPGLRGVWFTEDGRWGFVPGFRNNTVYIVDTVSNRIDAAVPVGDGPDQVAFTRTFAYVRSLKTEFVTMIPLSELGKGHVTGVKKFAAGAYPPGQSPSLSFAPAIVSTPEVGSVAVTNPADKTVFYYMEGMTAPASSFRNYGHEPKVVEVVNRRLKETAPGVYSSTVPIPTAGNYEVPFLLDTPRIFHCFSLTVKSNPAVKKAAGIPIHLEFLTQGTTIPAGAPARVRFRVTDAATGKLRTDLVDLLVRTTFGPGTWQDRQMAKHVGEGIYEVELSLPQEGAYRVSVECFSLGVHTDQLPKFDLRVPDTTTPGKTGGVFAPGRSRKALEREKSIQ
jgi:YVTN family beta-propeller protein